MSDKAGVRRDCVVLDRVEPGEPKPDYCVHGRVTCAVCYEWCWLGDKTHEAVASGRLTPLCHQCVVQYVSPDVRPVGNLGDHRRADGPHDG
jgi:hypothetical protein